MALRQAHLNIVPAVANSVILDWNKFPTFYCTENHVRTSMRPCSLEQARILRNDGTGARRRRQLGGGAGIQRSAPRRSAANQHLYKNHAAFPEWLKTDAESEFSAKSHADMQARLLVRPVDLQIKKVDRAPHLEFNLILSRPVPCFQYRKTAQLSKVTETELIYGSCIP